MANKASSRARVRVRVLADLFAFSAVGGGQGGGGQAGVEGVEGVVSAAQPPHRAAERGDEWGVFAFDVAGDQGAHPEPDQADDEAFGDRGLPDPGLALHPHPGVADQPGA
jgi:hypothetical protein